MKPVRKLQPSAGDNSDTPASNPRASRSEMNDYFDVHYSVDGEVPTLSESGERSYLFLEMPDADATASIPVPDTGSINEILNTGTVRISPELLQQIAQEIKEEILDEVKSLLRTTIPRQVCQAISVASKDMHRRIQAEVEVSLPELMNLAVKRSRETK